MARARLLLHGLSRPFSHALAFLSRPFSRAPAMAGVGSPVRRLYLSVYNYVVFFGWAQVLYYAVLTLRESGHEAVYAAIEKPLQFAQTAAASTYPSSVAAPCSHARAA